MMDHHIVTEVTALQLLHEYQADASFFLSSPKRTILTKGTFAAISEPNTYNLPQRAASILKDAEQSGLQHPILVGTVPFDGSRSIQLTVPTEVWQTDPLQVDQREEEMDSSMVWGVVPVPEPEEYMRCVEQGLARIGTGELSKIVLSRSLQLNSSEKVDIGQLLYKLAQHNPSGYTFAVDVSERNSRTTKRRTLIGASPELLVSRSGIKVLANPLAGSRPRSHDMAEDRRRAEELLSSEKDLHEHAVVVEAVSAALKPFCKTLEVPSTPSLINTETMWHLSTEVTGELIDPSISSLELALALHPTPAVCGTPTDLAKTAIEKIEPFDRGFYTGIVGWCDAKGDGEWIVTLRCAEAEERSLRLFAGAGIVAGSSPEEELAETSAKFRTMLLAMGLEEND
ncbi:isochorismate synthase DhbC [Bacillus sp. CLL-7-23]|uniref:isochorismate synthase n=1 Tax=Bacillus changyiensis TaxID=3004103 RepID=A0ABT4WZE6_9BACI|nr:isochorismate synthase DhbC [Bacillus changyiensis]MDA7025411.1 isochorismate synthase DhbC [Bacillus changyiensis]